MKQTLRLRRFLFASAFSVLYLVVLFVFHTQDKIDRATLLQACVIVLVLILAFWALFRTGLNLRFPDASLTAWQFLASVFTMLYIVYRAPDTRLVFAAFFFVALMFSMLRHSGRKLAVLGVVSLLSFALMIGFRYVNQHDDDIFAPRRAPVRRHRDDAAVVPVHRWPREAPAARPYRSEHQAGRHRGAGAARRSHRRLQPSRAARGDGGVRGSGPMRRASRCRFA